MDTDTQWWWIIAAVILILHTHFLHPFNFLGTHWRVYKG